MNYEIVKYDPIYNDQICELEKEIWSPDSNVNRSYLQWKYFDNPHADSPKIYLVLYEGVVIAVRGMYETRWQLGTSDESFIALCAADLVIHKDYRNKGLYSELMNFARNDLYGLGYQYLFSFSAGPASLINSLALGWKSIGKIRVMSKEFYPRPIIQKLMSHNTIKEFIKRTIAAKYLKIPAKDFKNYEELKYHKKIAPQIRIDKNPMPDEMASLVRKLITNNKIVLTRDEKFFSWRYGNPLSKYIFLYWFDDELEGYLAAQTPLYKYDYMNKFNIIELEAVNSTIKIELLKTLIYLLDSRSISVWSNMLNDNCRKFLESKRFIETGSTGSAAEYTPTVLIRTTNGSANNLEFHGMNLLDMNNWDLKMIYSDAF